MVVEIAAPVGGTVVEVHAGEGELHLGLDARRARDATARRPRREVVQQRGLADPRLAAHDQHATLARPHIRQQPVECVALATPAAQSRPTKELGHTHRRGWKRTNDAVERTRMSSAPTSPSTRPRPGRLGM